jgi:branched-chain amino acid transport system ATP-binding protein
MAAFRLSRAWTSRRQGELVSLIGSNGAGKTTTMKAITRHAIADGGEISTWAEHQGRAPGIWWPKAWSWCPKAACLPA